MSMAERLDVHFLNVDHGDCTILVHPEVDNSKEGRVTFVDINDWKDKKSDSYNNAVAGLNPRQEALAGHMDVAELKANYISPETYAEEYLDDPVEYYQELSSGIQSSTLLPSLMKHVEDEAVNKAV
jgi:competence protein ComEC